MGESALSLGEEQPGFTYWECQDCGCDAVTDDRLLDKRRQRPTCPLCAGDSGRDVVMSGRVARTSDVKVEGLDARTR